MRRQILLLLCGLVVASAAMAQVSSGREFPRTPTISYPSVEEARAHSTDPSRYFQPLDGWKHIDGVWTTSFKVPFAWADRRVFLHLENAGSLYAIAVNGKDIGWNESAATAAEFDLTAYAIEGVNTLEIVVAKEDLLSAGADNKLGKTYIFSQPPVRIRDYVISPLTDAVELGVIVKSHLLNPKTVRVYYSFINPDGTEGPYGHRDADFEMKSEDTVRFFVPLPEPRLWSHEAPYLYTLDLKLQYEGRYTEYVSYRVGLRTIGHGAGQLVVNGRPVTLTAENTLHLHEPAPDSVYTEADRRGLYVIGTADINTSRFGTSRARGGNPSNDPANDEAYIDRALTMYHTSKSHPSAAAFALAEKSANGYNLYESYLAMKRAEPSRPVIYPDGGEWNSDTLRLGEVAPQPHVEVGYVRDTVWMDGKRERHGKVFRLTNGFETAALHSPVVDWKVGRARGSVKIDGVVPAGESREFVVEHSKPGQATFSVYRPVEHFDPPRTANKRGLIPVD